MKKIKSSELWAIVDLEGNIFYSRGGSSTAKKLLVYDSKETAERVLKTPWIKQILPEIEKVKISKIYDSKM